MQTMVDQVKWHVQRNLPEELHSQIATELVGTFGRTKIEKFGGTTITYLRDENLPTLRGFAEGRIGLDARAPKEPSTRKIAISDKDGIVIKPVTGLMRPDHDEHFLERNGLYLPLSEDVGIKELLLLDALRSLSDKGTLATFHIADTSCRIEVANPLGIVTNDGRRYYIEEKVQEPYLSSKEVMAHPFAALYESIAEAFDIPTSHREIKDVKDRFEEGWLRGLTIPFLFQQSLNPIAFTLNGFGIINNEDYHKYVYSKDGNTNVATVTDLELAVIGLIKKETGEPYEIKPWYEETSLKRLDAFMSLGADLSGVVKRGYDHKKVRDIISGAISADEKGVGMRIENVYLKALGFEWKTRRQ